MDRLIRCECGFVARSDSDDRIIEEIRKHMEQDHPALIGKVSSEDLRSWIEVE